MKNYAELPEGCTELFQLDLQKNKKTALLVNALALAIAAACFFPALALVPITALFNVESLPIYLVRMGVLLGGFAAYMALHELVHGVFMYRFSGRKPHYGFTGLYAYAGSDACFCRRDYLIIALAPVVIWGVVLAVINALVPAGWFWVVWLIQIGNLSGAAGDLYVTVKFLRLPPDILVVDTGVSMTVYAPGPEE